MTEGTLLDKKSIRVLATDPRKWAWRNLAADCAGFANARGGSLTALEFSRLLQIEGDDSIRAWLRRLPEQGVVLSRGRNRGTEYFVNPAVLRVASYRVRPRSKPSSRTVSTTLSWRTSSFTALPQASRRPARKSVGASARKFPCKSSDRRP